ncbi:MAG: GNAT family N-acetyltransferase [Bifidobacteriaceae bacterium]|jgi:RimJ/RimL family protein N-acetyltransferase|nr:GNAT family N-acetyltransferase [Bifidobacteriaceae bacterium]
MQGQSHSSENTPHPLLRRATLDDLSAMMSIINSAKSLLKADGIPQWQNGSPNEAIIGDDIARGWAYVLDLDGEIVASSTLWQEDDPNYAKIYDGSWRSPRSGEATSTRGYATIHRSCVSSAFHGLKLGSVLLDELIGEAKNLGFHEVRIDTHRLNKRMQHLIAKAGFEYAGVVYMKDDPHPERLSYQIFV